MPHTTEVVVVVVVTKSVRIQSWHTRDRSGDVLVVVHARRFWVDAGVSGLSTLEVATRYTGARTTVATIIPYPRGVKHQTTTTVCRCHIQQRYR